MRITLELARSRFLYAGVPGRTILKSQTRWKKMREEEGERQLINERKIAHCRHDASVQLGKFITLIKILCLPVLHVNPR